MELIEANQLPGMVQRFVRITELTNRSGKRGDEFRIVQQKFTFAIGAFIAGLCRVRTAMQFQIEFAVPGWQFVTSVGF